MSCNLKKIQQVADAMNAGNDLPGVFLYRLGSASPDTNQNEEHQVFTDGKNQRCIGHIGKVGGEGPFVPFMHLDGGRMVFSLDWNRLAQHEPKMSTKNYEVIVGNIGTVYLGSSLMEANAAWGEYKRQSKANYGRAAGESVAFFEDGELVRELISSVDNEQE